MTVVSELASVLTHEHQAARAKRAIGDARG